jgi:hypothetical protein
MRKHMRSTARTPGTEDHSVEGNAHRSRGAEAASNMSRTPRWRSTSTTVPTSQCRILFISTAGSAGTSFSLKKPKHTTA